MSPAEEDRCLTVAEVSARWRCEKRLVLKQLRTGALPGFRAGGVWRIWESAVKNYEQVHTPVPNPVASAPGRQTKYRRASPASNRRIVHKIL